MPQIVICDVCRGVLERRRNAISEGGTRNYAEFGHHRTWASLQRSVDASCWLCTTFKNRTSILQGNHLLCGPEYGCSPIRTSAHNFVTCISIDTVSEFGYVAIRHSRDSYVHFELLEAPAEEPEQRPLVQDSHDIQSTSSAESLHVAANWLHHCVNTHTDCSSSSSKKSWFPTRLLDLGKTDAYTAVIRLVLTTQETPVGPYATLSHCWGHVKFIQLTRSSLSEYCTGINIRDMPKTFQDTIAVCRYLHIRYLWIDSVCIMQDKDDLSDWSREASLMHKVYTYSHCNIAASDAPDGTHGLFRTRFATDVEPVKIKIALRGAPPREYNCEEKYFWRLRVNDTVLNKRGWVFQERLLAPRVLIFGHDQILWECRVHGACEKYPRKLPAQLTPESDNKANFNYHKYLQTPASRNDGRYAHCYGLWDEVVRSYTHTTLTNSSDKMIAISGIAKSFAIILGDIYVVGMWRGHLHQGLMWKSWGFGHMRTRPTDYRAPTWSWASIEGPVDYVGQYYRTSAFRVHIKDVVLVHETEDTTGQVRRGHLDLQGDLKPLFVILLPQSDTPVVRLLVDGLGKPSGYHHHPRFDVSDIDTSKLLEDSAKGRLYYMNFQVAVKRICWMMLRLVNEQQGIFERIGLNVTYLGDGRDALDALLVNLDNDTKRGLPCLRYEDGKHTIRII